MNYSMLIVDDEYYICEGLKTKIENLKIPSIGEIRTCYSGSEALEICKEYKPELILTDIKMGKINGIHLIHQLKQMLHPVRFLVCSGYDDYEYVRSAFQEGAVDYLLKPVLAEQLDTILRSQCDSLKKSYIGDITSRGKAIEFFEHFLKTIEDEENTQEYKKMAEQIQQYLPQNNYTFSLAAAPELKPVQINHLINFIYDYFKQYENTEILCGKLTASKIAVLINHDDKWELPKSYGESILNYTQEKFHRQLALALSNAIAEPDFRQLCTETENILAERLILGYGNIFMHRQIAVNQKILEKAQKSTLILMENPKLLDKKFYQTQLFETIRVMNVGTLLSFYQYLTGVVCSKLSGYLPSEKAWRSPTFYNFDSLEQFETSIIELLRKYVLYSGNTDRIDSQLDMVKKYIDEHFSENLTLSDVAEHFFISYAYLSTIFHDTFGMSFQSYIISKRMKYAEELLHKPDLSIQEIASLTGYTNVFNFSRSFKNYFGISPSHYRLSRQE